ncbi:MAG: thrombospondin type 3 repeat-containing protein [Proteobacteria bacterium]|nr:thrombospondin type 3 repeat-containing protein [Pseudomonadota bacterium]
MKHFLLLTVLTILSTSLPATERPRNWSDLDSSCFLERSRIIKPGTDTLKIRIPHRDQVFFVQNNKVLLHKIFEMGRLQYIDYSVLYLSGVAPKDLNQAHLLFDGNYKSTLSFDPYSDKPFELVIDANKQLKPGTFSVQLHYQGKASIQYFVSKNNQHYIEVENSEAYTWRYLKIRFNPPEKQENKRYPVSIRELSILNPAPVIYLVKPNDHSPIDLYASFECLDEDYPKLYEQSKKGAQKTAFSINSSTRLVDLDYNTSPLYNNDFDNDGIPNHKDNCRFKANHSQLDGDRDLVGDACDFDKETRNFYDRDSDNDGIGDSLDNCVYLFNPKQQDSNADKRGDLCSDDDGDGIPGHLDNCLNISNADQKDININGIGDACEFDKDNDGVFDSIDNCLTLKNQSQSDQDNDGIGDACDNCALYNPSQLDVNQNGKGDRCEEEDKFLQANDKDGDGIIDNKDNCINVANNSQRDTDRDGIGDACDNCANLQNADQLDLDKNGVGDMCEDSDNDEIIGHLDNCPSHANKNQADADNDGVGNVCEDDDGDGFVAAEDNCPFHYNKDQRDNDRDGIGDICDQKDDRLIESNKGFVIGIIVLITLVFGFLIFRMIRKIKSIDHSNLNSESRDE